MCMWWVDKQVVVPPVCLRDAPLAICSSALGLRCDTVYANAHALCRVCAGQWHKWPPGEFVLRHFLFKKAWMLCLSSPRLCGLNTAHGCHWWRDWGRSLRQNRYRCNIGCVWGWAWGECGYSNIEDMPLTPKSRRQHSDNQSDDYQYTSHLIWRYLYLLQVFIETIQQRTYQRTCAHLMLVPVPVDKVPGHDCEHLRKFRCFYFKRSFSLPRGATNYANSRVTQSNAIIM